MTLKDLVNLVTARAILEDIATTDKVSNELLLSARWRIRQVIEVMKEELEKGGTDEEKSMSEELPYKSQEAGGCKVIQFED